MTLPLLQVRNLRVVFDLPEGQMVAVRNVSFRIRAGTTVALVGESGSGKSVVSQSIMGILPKAARIAGGEILFEDPANKGTPINIAGLDQDSLAMRAIRGGKISIIFQEPMTSLSPLHTVGDQIGEALLLHRPASRSEADELTEEMLRLVGFPDPARALRTYPFELSGGLRQRAMIAMALICRPALLIADEPTTALDVTIQAQILKLMRDLQQEFHMAMLLITHDLGVVANMAEEVVVMYRGSVMEAGPAYDIFRRPAHPYLKALMHAVPRFNMEPGERLVPLRAITHEPGNLASFGKTRPAAPKPGETPPPLLKVSGITKRYGLRKGSFFGGAASNGVLAVDDVSFQIERGECLGLVGESGCGKTTLSKVLMRALTPDSGEVIYDDGTGPVDLLGLDGNRLTDFRKRMQFVFQDPFSSLNPRMTVYDIVAEPLVIHRLGDDEERRERVKELMRIVGLDVRHLQRYPHSFSGGQRQRIGIARALALGPDLIICDEPVSALDVSIQAQILNLLRDLQKELGLTYLFISHNLAVVDYIAQRIAVMCRGRLVELAPREALFANPVHPYTQALLAAVPEPDLDHPLDFKAVMDAKASIPSAWPSPFTIDDGGAAAGEDGPRLVEIAPGHFVRKSDPAAPEPKSEPAVVVLEPKREPANAGGETVS